MTLSHFHPNLIFVGMARNSVNGTPFGVSYNFSRICLTRMEVTDSEFVTVSHLHPSLIFSGKSRSSVYVAPYRVSPSFARNIRLGWK